MVDKSAEVMDSSNRRLLAVDPGELHIGLAISDQSGTIGRPLSILKHISRIVDAASIAAIARENGVTLIIVGQALDVEGHEGPAARKASRLTEAIKIQTDTPVILWDESGTTVAARDTLLEMGISRSRRRGHQDALAAALILKSYLDAHRETS
jgi:putative Holliday junction resolvase